MNHRRDDSYDEHLREGARYLSEVSLPDAARVRIRGSIVAFARENPPAEGVSPRHLEFPGVESPWASELLSMEVVTRPALASVLVALLVGSTISYAAEVALPGDPLYWVKTGVSETVADIITVSDAAQVEWDARKVERRLEEALALAAADRLDGAARNQIEAGLERGIAEFSEHVGMILNEDPSLALAAKAQLEATLRAHQEVLDGLVRKDRESEAAAIADRARALADAVSSGRAALEAASAKETTFLRDAASAKADVASREVEAARRALAKNYGESRVGSATEADAAAKLSLSAESYDAGNVAARAGDYPTAFAEYQNAHQFAKEARLIAVTDGRSAGGGGEGKGEGKNEEKGGGEDALSGDKITPDRDAGSGEGEAADAKSSGASELRVNVGANSGAGADAGIESLNLP